MNTEILLDELKKLARKDTSVKNLLLSARKEKEPLLAFCRIACELGFELYPMDIINAGEEFYASMRRSTNGGGENSPMLEGEDDYFEMFFSEF